MSKELHKYPLRINKELFSALVVEAEAEDLSVNQLIAKILRDRQKVCQTVTSLSDGVK